MRIFLSAILFVLIISGCESNNSFRTKSGIESDLQGTWDKVRIPITTYKETFEFKSGKLYNHQYFQAQGAADRIDTCTYEIIANIATPYVIIHNNKPDNYTNGRWVIIQLDNKFLTINHQEDNTNGTIQREFVKL